MDPWVTINNIIQRKGFFLIAEAGCNFEGSYEIAKQMVIAAAQGGVDAIKFQTFNPDLLVTKSAPKFWDIEGCPGETQYEEFVSTKQLSDEDFRELLKIASDHNIYLFSTPSDEESVDFLESLNIPFYKISSMDITHLPLIRYIAKKGKPIFLSTGASTIDEIFDAVSVIEYEGNNQIFLLHCISLYPSNPEDVNLRMMIDIQNSFPRYCIGYSDHTIMPESLQVLISALSLGAKVIEKHFTFDKNRPGYDHKISMDYSDISEIDNALRNIEKILGSSKKGPINLEQKSRELARRSIVSKRRIHIGEILTENDVVIKRPGYGIIPKHIGEIIGKTAKQDIPEEVVLQKDMFE